MTPTAVISGRLGELRDVIAASLPHASPTSIGFVRRLVGAEVGLPDLDRQTEAEASGTGLVYGGIPTLACCGFELARQPSPEQSRLPDFLAAVGRLRGRPSSVHDQLGGDDVALLGIADGLAHASTHGLEEAGACVSWLVTLTDRSDSGPIWSRRLRALAADLLDHRGRLRAELPAGDLDALALDLCLRRTWPIAFATFGPPPRDTQRELMHDLLTRPCPEVGDLESATVWVGALHALVRDVAITLVPDVGEVVRLLKGTQGGLKRWVWEHKPRRAHTDAARWLIDSEAHVQAYLWSVLYPVFGAQLLDENHLRGFGLKEPRFDFAIANLKLLVEVKIVRTLADFGEVEEQIAGDTGIYFSDPSRFDRMVAYIYDDCDEHRPERYDALVNALKQRDRRIIDVVIVRRPGMLPDRASRSRPPSADVGQVARRRQKRTVENA